MRRSLSTIICFATLAALSPSRAAARAITDVERVVTGDPGAAALAFVGDHLRRLGVAEKSQAGTLAVARTVRLGGQGQGLVVHVGQRVAGLPVLGADVAVLILGHRIIAATGKLLPLPALPAAAAGATLSAERLSDALQGWKGATGVVIRRATRALLHRASSLRPVYVVDAMTASPFEIWRVLVDARDGALLYGRTARRHVDGKAYLPNPVVGQVERRPLLGLTSTEQLTGEHADVSRCAVVGGMQLDCTRLAVPDEDGNYLYEPDDPSMDDPFAEVHAYYHVDAFHRWLGEQFDFSRAGGHTIRVLVNFHYLLKGGQPYGVANAFFGDVDGDGRGEIVFGQGQRDFAYDADVIYHELTHSVVAETSNLTSGFDERGFNSVPGSLNEGFADLLSSAFAGDGTVGEYAGGLYGGSSIRDLVGPALRCPDDLIGESHHDGLIWGRALWTARQMASDKPAVDRVLYVTMASLAEQSSFSDAAALLLKVAQISGPLVSAQLGAVVKDAGFADCGRIVPLDDQRLRSGLALGTRELYGAQQVPAALQYKISVPDNAVEMRLLIQQLGSAAPTMSAYLRRDQPVTIDGQLRPIDAEHSFRSDGTFFALRVGSDDSTDSTDSNDGADKLVPGGTYYLLPVNTGEATGQYQLLVAYTLVDVRDRPADQDYRWPDPDDTGPYKRPSELLSDQEPADDIVDSTGGASVSGAGGCALSGAPGARGLPWGLLGLLALGWLCRRRG